MRLVLAFALLVAPMANGAGIDPEATELPWMNHPTRDSVYRLSENRNKVHVWEALRYDCGYCQQNAEQVKALAREYADNERVQFIDLSLDQVDRDVLRWIEQHEPEYPVLKDVNRAVYDALRSRSGVPQTFVTDCRGQLVGSTFGYWGAGQIQQLRSYIARALRVVCE